MESGALYSSVEEVARMVDSVPNEEHSEDQGSTEEKIASLKQLDACEGASSTLFKAIKDPRPMKLKFVKSGAAHGGVEHLQEPSEYQRRVNSDARFTGSFVEHDALEEEARLNAATVELMNVLSISTRPPAGKAFNDTSASPVNSDGTAVNSPYATTDEFTTAEESLYCYPQKPARSNYGASANAARGGQSRRTGCATTRWDGERIYYTTPKGARYYLDEWGCCIFDHLPRMAQTDDKQNQQQPQNFEYQRSDSGNDSIIRNDDVENLANTSLEAYNAHENQQQKSLTEPQNFEYQRSDSADDSIIRNDVENFANTSLEGQEQQQKVLTTENFGEQKHETESNYANVICQDNSLQYGSFNHFNQPPAPFPYQPLAPHSSTPTFGIGFHQNHQQVSLGGFHPSSWQQPYQLQYPNAQQQNVYGHPGFYPHHHQIHMGSSIFHGGPPHQSLYFSSHLHQFYQIPPQQLFQPSFMEWGQADPAYQQQQTYVPPAVQQQQTYFPHPVDFQNGFGYGMQGPMARQHRRGGHRQRFHNGQQKIDVGVSHDITPPALRTFQTRVDKGNVNPANSPFLEILPPIHANHIMSMLPPHMRSVTTPRVKPKAEAPAPTPFDFKFCENLPTDTVERAIIVLSKPKNGWGLNVKARREEDLHALPPKPEKKKRRRGNRVRKPKKEDTKALVTLWTPDIGKPNVASESTRSRAPSVTTRSAMTSVTTRNATPNATPRVSKWMAARESVVLERK